MQGVIQAQILPVQNLWVKPVRRDYPKPSAPSLPGHITEIESSWYLPYLLKVGFHLQKENSETESDAHHLP